MGSKRKQVASCDDKYRNGDVTVGVAKWSGNGSKWKWVKVEMGQNGGEYKYILL